MKDQDMLRIVAESGIPLFLFAVSFFVEIHL